MTLDDVCILKVNFVEADFWLKRKGSEDTVGSPTKIFYEEDIGVKVKEEFLNKIDSNYLYYYFMYLHQRGVFSAISHGTLKLKNIKLSDIKSIPISFQQPINENKTIKILVTEEQFNLITEASKVDILVNKIGLNPKVAEEFYEIAGPLSVWLVNKFLEDVGAFDFEYMMSAIPSEDEKKAREDYRNNIKTRIKWGLNYLNRKGLDRDSHNQLTGIMDWIRVGLNGDIGQIRNTNWNDLMRGSRAWHKSLQIGKDSINYVETNEIVRDYRNENGIGFYWVNLNTNDSREECDRMGHCGRTNLYNTILSLREYKSHNSKYTINKSHITCAVGKEDGIIYQTKGPINSKPDSKYYTYIVDLIVNSTNPEIKGFGSEYGSEHDFKLNDLSDDVFLDLYEKKPHLFTKRSTSKRLKKLGIDVPQVYVESKFILDVDIKNVRYFLDDDIKIGTYRRRDGTSDDVYISERLLEGDYYDHWNNYSSLPLIYIIDRIINPTNIERIKKIISYDDDSDDIFVNMVQDNNDVSDAIQTSYDDAASDTFLNVARKSLYEALSEYGTIMKFDGTGVEIEIDMDKIIDNSGLDEHTIDEYYDECNDDLNCVYNFIVGEYYDKPSLNLDQKNYVVDSDYFNEILSDRLNEYEN